MQLCNCTPPAPAKQAEHERSALVQKTESKHSLAHNSALGRGSWPTLLIYNPSAALH